eukprot:TRINITY_DN26146_c0_g1_i5.p2 TRINITY_DN26146_c0_g1~~TRINITY_DN26146_c0_g1_i5.p2  ORF type:complete len:215 (+),score=53.15 TRINITY_DN26146_c0_g1_i5:151-795(+)
MPSCCWLGLLGQLCFCGLALPDTRADEGSVARFALLSDGAKGPEMEPAAASKARPRAAIRREQHVELPRLQKGVKSGVSDRLSRDGHLKAAAMVELARHAVIRQKPADEMSPSDVEEELSQDPDRLSARLEIEKMNEVVQEAEMEANVPVTVNTPAPEAKKDGDTLSEETIFAIFYAAVALFFVWTVYYSSGEAAVASDEAEVAAGVSEPGKAK